MASSPSSAISTAQRERLEGREEPRIWTPPLRPLNDKTSLGFAAIEFAEDVLGVELYPWQRWLLVHMLELLPDGSFRFRTAVVLVARQNGKSTLSVVLSLFFMFVLGTKLVIGTAQDLDVAEEIWGTAVEFVEDVPELDALKKNVVKVNGKKSLDLWKDEERRVPGPRYKVKAANRRAGRGLSGDLILLDELREHQSWDAWAAVTKTTMARSNALVAAFSNAGDATSVVLRYLRKMAHAELGDPDGLNADEAPADLLPDDDEFGLEADDSLGIFEWSAVPGCAVGDREGWCQANPSLGYGIMPRTINAAARTDPEWVFRTEVLCQWSDGFLEGPFPPGAWEGTADEGSKIGDGNRIAVCVDVSWDRSVAHVAIAGLRDDKLPHVGVIASRAGTEWVVPWLLGPDAPPFSICALQANGAPVSSLLEDIQAASKGKFEVVEWFGAELARATGAFYDSVRIVTQDGGAGKGLRHRSQPVLDTAAAAAVARPMGDGFVWDRKKSPVDVSPLVAVTGALWAATRTPEPPKKSAYEDRGLEVIG